MSLGTQTRMTGHAFDVGCENPKLLLLAAVHFTALLAILALFLLPVAQATPADVWNWLWHFRHEQEALREAGSRVLTWWAWPLPTLAGVCLAGRLLADFFDCAIFSQSIHALNGGRVSIRRGFMLAVARLPAIVAWSLLNSTLGLLLRVLGERIGTVRRIVRNSFGVSWGAASMFVIPVMLNEPRASNPFECLKISGGIARRMWGEDVHGMMGPANPGSHGPAALLFGIIVFTGSAAIATHMYSLLLWGLLIVFACSVAGHVLFRIYLGGLYIFATEGVLPGPFNDDLFRRAWVVRGTT